MKKVSAQELRSLAEGGDADAQYALAGNLAASGLRDDSNHWLDQAAKAGHPDALFTMATRVMNSESDVAANIDDLTNLSLIHI